MQCNRCKKESVIFQPYSGQHLCREHFILDFEAKAKRTIRRRQWMQPGDRIAVALTGNAADEALLLFFQDLAGRRNDIRLEGIPVTASLREFAADALAAGYTKIAVSAALEETAASLLADIVQGRADRLFDPDCRGIPFITPFCQIPSGEVTVYAGLKGVRMRAPQHPAAGESISDDVASLLDEYSRCHPGAPYAVLNLRAALEAYGKEDRSCSDN